MTEDRIQIPCLNEKRIDGKKSIATDISKNGSKNTQKANTRFGSLKQIVILQHTHEQVSKISFR